MTKLSSLVRLPFVLGASAGAAVLLSLVRQAGRRMNFKDASVVITGGSRGLGLELARIFAAEGARITLIARNELELERARRELADSGADVRVHSCDIRKEEEAERAVNLILNKLGRIDVLVNNAGVIQVGPFESLDRADYEDAMGVHLWGPLNLIRAVVPHMKKQGSGRIVNITSIGGLVAIPHMLAYSMSKFALVGLSDGLRAELMKDGIYVTTVAPGLMRTGSHVNALFKGRYQQEFAWFSVLEGLPLFSTDARRAAGQIVRACRYGDPKLVITVQARLLYLMNTVFPDLTALFLNIAGRLLPGPAGEEGHESHTGWESRSSTPGVLTRLADNAIGRNNEIP